MTKSVNTFKKNFKIYKNYVIKTVSFPKVDDASTASGGDLYDWARYHTKNGTANNSKKIIEFNEYMKEFVDVADNERRRISKNDRIFVNMSKGYDVPRKNWNLKSYLNEPILHGRYVSYDPLFHFKLCKKFEIPYDKKLETSLIFLNDIFKDITWDIFYNRLELDNLYENIISICDNIIPKIYGSVIKYYYGFNSYGNHTLKQTAQYLYEAGLTEEVLSNGRMQHIRGKSIRHFAHPTRLQSILQISNAVYVPKLPVELIIPVYNNTNKISIDRMKLSRRLYNCLHRHKLYTISDILEAGREKISDINTLGEKSMYELDSKLSEYGIELK